MASAYPGALDSFATNKANATATTTDHPTHHNDLADAVNKIEAELGVTPSGAAATVAARLDSLATLKAVLAPYVTDPDNVDHVWWDGNDVAAGTTLSITGIETLVEANGRLSVKYDNQADQDLNCVLFARTIAIGDKWRVPIKFLGRSEDFSFNAILLTDGVVATSNVFAVLIQRGAGAIRYQYWHGTLTALATNALDFAAATSDVMTDQVLEIEYVAANSFIGRWGDGFQNIPFTGVATPKPMTPTHVAVGWSKYGGGEECVVTFGPLTSH